MAIKPRVFIRKSVAEVSFERKIDWMIGNHYSEYQDELILGRQLHALLKRIDTHMPHGYPPEVYRPGIFFKQPKNTRFIHKPGGILSNGVPKVLGCEIIEGYLLGLYNPDISTQPPTR